MVNTMIRVTKQILPSTRQNGSKINKMAMVPFNLDEWCAKKKKKKKRPPNTSVGTSSALGVSCTQGGLLSIVLGPRLLNGINSVMYIAL